MNTNRAILLALWVVVVLFAVSVMLRFVVLGRVGVLVGWILYPGLPIAGAGALTVFLVRLGLLKLDEGSSGTFSHPHHHITEASAGSADRPCGGAPERNGTDEAVTDTIEQHINRVDRTPSLITAISCGLLAFWSLYPVLRLLYLTTTSNFLFASLMFAIVLWGLIGIVAVTAATAFLARYARRP